MSSYVSVEVKLANGENKSRSTQWSSQSCVNMYIDAQDSGRTQFALLPWPGEKLFSRGVAGKINRGFRTVNGVPFVLVDRSLYRIEADGTQKEVAEIPGNGLVAMADDGFNLLIRSNGSADYLNGKFILSEAGATYLYNENGLTIINLPELVNTGEYCVSDVNDPTRFQAINRSEASLSRDVILQTYIYQKKVIFAGSESTEFYYDSGEGNPPIAPIQQASTTLIGAGSRFSMAETPDALYMLSNEGVVYKLVNFAMQSITPSAIAKELRKANKTNAQGYTAQLDGQWFYILQLPESDLTLVYSEMFNKWLRLSSGSNTKIRRHRMAGYSYAYGKHLIADSASSSIFEWDFDTFTSDGETIIRQFDTAPINGLMIGLPGKRLVMNRARFITETGVGNYDTITPKMMISPSFDGGRTHDTENWINLKRAGESTALVDWYKCMSFYDMCLRVRISDPAFTGFHSAVLDIKPGGD